MHCLCCRSFHARFTIDGWAGGGGIAIAIYQRDRKKNCRRSETISIELFIRQSIWDNMDRIPPFAWLQASASVNWSGRCFRTWCSSTSTTILRLRRWRENNDKNYWTRWQPTCLTFLFLLKFIICLLHSFDNVHAQSVIKGNDTESGHRRIQNQNECSCVPVCLPACLPACICACFCVWCTHVRTAETVRAIILKSNGSPLNVQNYRRVWSHVYFQLR